MKLMKDHTPSKLVISFTSSTIQPKSRPYTPRPRHTLPASQAILVLPDQPFKKEPAMLVAPPPSKAFSFLRLLQRRTTPQEHAHISNLILRHRPALLHGLEHTPHPITTLSWIISQKSAATISLLTHMTVLAMMLVSSHSCFPISKNVHLP